jgi:hypothetical protein
MGWTAGDSDESSVREDGAAATTGKTDAGTQKAGSKRGIWLILGGLVVTGAAAGWSWLRRLPRD